MKTSRKMIAKICWSFLAVFLLVACETSIVRTSHDNGSPGLVYFLPQGWLKVTIRIEQIFKTMNSDRPLVTVPLSVVPEVVLAADRDASYLLKMTPSAAADDYIQLKVTNGLLESVSMTNTDQTLGIMSNITQTIIESLHAAFPLPGGAPLVAEGQTYFTNYVTNIYYIDPFAASALPNSDYIADYNPNKVVLHFNDFAEDASAVHARANEDAKEEQARQLLQNSGKWIVQSKIKTADQEEGFSGVYYRPLKPYYISWDTTGTYQLHGESLVWIPDKGSRNSLEAKRAFGVKQNISFVFQQGIPSAITLNKPSQALAITGFPLTVLKQLTGLPTNLFQFKIDTTPKASTASSNAGVSIVVSNVISTPVTNLLQVSACCTNKGAVTAAHGDETLGQPGKDQKPMTNQPVAAQEAATNAVPSRPAVEEATPPALAPAQAVPAIPAPPPARRPATN